MTRETHGHEPLRLAVAVVARRDEQAVRREEPEQHAPDVFYDVGDVFDVVHVVEDVGRVRR